MMNFDIYDNAMMTMITSQVHQIRKNRTTNNTRSSTACCVVCITGGPQSGKRTLAQYLSTRICVQLLLFEVQPVAISSVHKLTSQILATHKHNPFTAVAIVCALHCEKADILLPVSTCISPSKLFTHLGVTRNRLKIHQWNITRAMNRNTDIEIGDLHMKLFHCLYTKRCKTSIRKVAEDLDYLAFLENLGSLEMTNEFVKRRPHVML